MTAVILIVLIVAVGTTAALRKRKAN